MKLITWNIQWGRGADGYVDLDRIAAHAKHFADADVLCLQEVSAGFSELPGCDGNDQFAELAARFPDHHPVAGAAIDVAGNGDARCLFGNMLLSRYPVLRICRHLLPWPAEQGVQSMQRIAVDATLEVPFGPLRVTTTHLEYYSASQRQIQVGRLRDLHKEAVEHVHNAAFSPPAEPPFRVSLRGGPAILAGDFNFTPESPEYRMMTEAITGDVPRYVDSWALAHPGAAHEPTLGMYDKQQWPGPPFTCDFIFVSEDLAARVEDVRVDGQTDASDHQPVLLILRDDA